MSTLDTVIQMQQSNMSDSEISRTLASQGISPRDINDAINQAKIKSAVTQQQRIGMEPPQPSITETGNMPQIPQGVSSNRQQPLQQGMQQQPQFSQETIQPSIMQEPQPTQPMPQEIQQPQLMQETPEPQQPMQEPQEQQQPMQEPMPSIMQEAPNQNYSEIAYPEQQQQQQYADDGTYYGDEGYYDDGYGGYADSGSMSEIAEQVVNEKFREFQKRTGDLALFKVMIEDKINSLDQRITRMENSIDKLQHAIIQKIGEFGENSAMIRKDLESLHNTTSKLMDPLIDKNRELERQRN